jgi:hypothetical protein
MGRSGDSVWLRRLLALQEKRGFICIDYGDPSTMRSCSMCVDARSGLLTLFGNEELIGFIFSECGV